MESMSLTKRRRNRKFLIVLILLVTVWFVLAIYPHIEIFGLSLYRWNGFASEKKYVGLQNFKQVFLTGEWLKYLKNTAIYVGFLLLIQTVLSVALAVALQKNTRHNRFFRAFFFIPMVFSSVMVGLTWSFVYDGNLGILNHLLVLLGLEQFEDFAWMGTNTSALLCIVIVHIWANMGYPLTILTAGLNNIPSEVQEAALVDGANKWQGFWHVTFPLLLPTILRLIMLTIATGAMAFDYILIMGSTLVDQTFDTWAVGIYKDMSLQSGNYGTIAVHSVLLGIMMIIIVAIQVVVSKKVDEKLA